jgi:hypothetical protein
MVRPFSFLQNGAAEAEGEELLFTTEVLDALLKCSLGLLFTKMFI